MILNNDVEEFYINSISHQSRCTSFEVVFSAQEGGIWRSFGIGFVGIVIQNLNAYWIDPIPILYQTAPLKLVFFVPFFLQKIALPCRAT